MHTSNSLIKTIIERVRTYMDEPETDGKYTDDFMVRHVIMPSMADVWGRLNLGGQNPVLLRLDVTLAADTHHYALPPCIGEVWRVGRFDTSRRLKEEWLPENYWHPQGPGWAIQGNVLSFHPAPPAGEVWTIEYVPSADFLMHYATDGELATSTTFVLSAAPALGPLDLRENAYAGSMLRIITATKVEELLIEEYDEGTRTATLRVASALTLSADGDPDPIAYTYEVVPCSSQPMAEAIAVASAIKVSTYRKVSEKDIMQLQVQYRGSMKSLLDRWGCVAMRRGRGWMGNTIDRQQLSEW